MPCPDTETLASMAENRLSGAERIAIANHAASCSSCRAVISSLLGWEPETTAPLTAGAHVDRYVIEERLGAGGMGVVYAARDPELGRRVALKLVRPGDDDERLRREAQALARLSHPNVVAVHDVGMHGDQLFIAMALVEGADLRRWLRTPRTVPDILRHLVAAGRGLAAAHAAGLIHRDLKPDNIFLSHDGQALVGDFGLARTLDDAEATPSTSRDEPAVTQLTVTGMVLGTPAYMAPEQRDGEATTASDQFGFCVTAWEALHGARPFAGDSLAAIEAAIREGRISPPPSDRNVPARVQRALRRGLSPDPAARFPSMDALLVELTPQPTRWPWVVGGVGVVGAAAAAAVLLASPAAERARTADGCRGPGALATRWNPARRTALETTLAARDAASDTARVLAGLDRYASAWNATRKDVCTAADPQRMDLVLSRLACLDQRALELDATIALVTSSDAITPADAWDAVDALRPVDRCRVAREVAPPARSAALDQARIELASVAARSDDRWNDLLAVRARIEPLGDPALLLDSLLLEAEVALLRANPAAAEPAARRALELAERLAADLDKAHAGALLTEALVELERATEAQGQLPQAIAALERGGGDREVALAVDRARASVARATNDPAAEIAMRRAILDEQQRRHDPTSRHIVAAAVELADAYQRNGQPDAATATYALVERGSGTDPTDALKRAIARATFDGVQALVAGETARAIEQTRIAVALHDRLDPGGRAHATEVYGLANVYELSGEWSLARDTYADAARRFRAAPAAAGPDVELGDALEGVARNALELGDSAVAVTAAREALAIAQAAVNPDQTQTSTLVLGRALLESGHPDEVIPLLDPVIRAMDTAGTAPAARRGSGSFVLAQALWATGGERERARARSLTEDAVRSLTSARDEYVSNPAYAAVLRIVDARIAAARDWQSRHP